MVISISTIKKKRKKNTKPNKTNKNKTKLTVICIFLGGTSSTFPIHKKINFDKITYLDIFI